MHKVFLSWSGNMSHQVALVLKDWLPVVIQSLDPFVSSEDIGKGTHWGEMLSQELNDTDYGILCITPYNIGCSWLNFEAGALSKSIKRSLVLPFLFKVNLDAFHGPIAQFQATIFDKQDVFELLNTVNNHFSDEEKLKAELLRRQFEKWWPDLYEALNKISDDPATETHSGIRWLYTSDDLAKMEVDDSVSSISIITPDFFRHALSDRMKPVMEANITRGVSYKLIAPRSRFTDGVRIQLRNISEDPSKLDVRDIPDAAFRSLAVTDYFILNPDDDKEHPLRVYLELPVNETDHWILVDREAAVGFTERFLKMWNCNQANESLT